MQYRKNMTKIYLKIHLKIHIWCKEIYKIYFENILKIYCNYI